MEDIHKVQSVVPLFFPIFVNDLHIVLTNCKTVIYADDTALLYAHHNVYHILEALKWELITLMQWFYASKILLNLRRTQHMIFNLRGIKLPTNSKIISAKY